MTLLSSCVDERIIEELGIVTVYGFDYSDSADQIDGTTVLYQFNPDITDASQIIHSTGNTFDGIRDNANKQSGYKIVNGQLQNVIFGPNMSENGIFPYLDSIERNTAVSVMLYVALSDEPTRNLLSASNYEEAPNIGIYLQRLIETAVRDERIVSSTFHEFMRSYFQVGKDPVVPILSEEDNKVRVNGIGALQDDVLVGEYTMEEAFYVRLLTDRFDSGRVELALGLEQFEGFISEHANREQEEEQMFLTIDQITSDTTIDLKDKDAINFMVEISMDARVIELSQRINLDNPEAIKLIQEAVEKKLESNLKEVVKKSKEMNTDVFGFGVEYDNRTRDEELTKKQWRDLFPTVEVDYQIDLEIKRFGTVQ
ncbi:spore germination protein GerSC [Alkalibacillus silvisoli]|uniref:Spore germination protein GerSC n=2 Tax=Alkalibacillus silvisoli TaxID=392823 RepID=A0ABP3K3U2_9BACI